MALRQLLREQAIESFRASYLRYEALLARIQEARSLGPYHPHGAAALRRLLATAGVAGSGEAHGDAECVQQGGGGGAHAAAAADAEADDAGPMGGALAALSSDLRRVALFTRSQFEQLWARLLDAVAALRAAAEELLRRPPPAATAGGGGGQPARLRQLRAALDYIGEDAVSLDRFMRHNVAAAAHLAQLADAPPGGGAAPEGEGGREEAEIDGTYLAAAERAVLGALRLDPLVLGLSDAYELLRLAEGDAAGGAAAAAAAARWVAPREFRRVTRKFWLLPADVARFKTEVAKHVPVLIYGDRQKLTEVDPALLPFLQPPAVRDSGAVTSVYFDNPRELTAYHERLRRADGAAVVRVRWYGDRAPRDPGQQLFVEQKVHREAYTDLYSTKERAPVEQRWMRGFVAGEAGSPELLDMASEQGAFLAAAQRVLVEGGMEPLLRTAYRRTAFQLATDNLLRVSLDTELVMSAEAPPRGTPRAHSPGDWCRDLSTQPLAQGEAVHFPYAVVEVKLQAKPPDWLKTLVRSGMLLVVPKFSKFLHGTAALYQERTENVPHWFLPDEATPGLMTSATWPELVDPSDKYLENAASWLFPSGFEPEPEPEPPAPAPAQRRRVPMAFLLRRGRVACAPPSEPPAEQQQQQRREPHVAAPLLASVAAGSGIAGNGQYHPTAGQYHPAQTPEPQQPCPAALAGLPGLHAAKAGGTAATSSRSWPVYQAPPRGVPQNNLPPLLPPACQGPAAAGGCELQGITVHCSNPQEGSVVRVHDVDLPPAAAGNHGARSHSHSGSERHEHGTGRSTPQDSAEDMEGGRRRGRKGDDPGALHAELSQRLNGGAEGGKPAGGGGAAGALPEAKSYGATQYQLQYQQPPAGLPPTRSGRALAVVRTRVEPKVFFANERTFLQWLHISVLVMFLALSLLSGSSISSSFGGGGGSGAGCAAGDSKCFAARLSGAIIAPVALLFMAYALFMYKKRTIQILRRETVRYDDQRGPVALVVILLVVMLISYIMTAVYVL